MRGGHLGFRALVVQEDRRYVLEMVLSYGIKLVPNVSGRNFFQREKQRARWQKCNSLRIKSSHFFFFFFLSSPFSDIPTAVRFKCAHDPSLNILSVYPAYRQRSRLYTQRQFIRISTPPLELIRSRRRMTDLCRSPCCLNTLERQVLHAFSSRVQIYGRKRRLNNKPNVINGVKDS